MLPHPGPYQIPEQTTAVVRAAFPKGTLAMRLADSLGLLYEEDDFAALYSATGRPSEDPVRLALVSVFQFLEGLSDRQAADAVRGRIDWKYAFGYLTLPTVSGTLLVNQAACQTDIHDHLL